MYRYQLASLEQVGAAKWDRFVNADPGATFFHLAAWERVIRQVYGHHTHYLAACEDGSIRALLPLVLIRSWLFGRFLVSTPFCVQGGPIGERQAQDWLLDQARELANRLGVDYLEVRSRQATLPAMQADCHHANFSIELAPTPEEILAGIKKKQRAVVRHSLQQDFAHRFDVDVDSFFRVYSESVRNLGTPVFPKRYFKALLAEFGSQCDILTVEHRGRPVSSVLSFYFRDQVLPYYGGGIRQARDLKSNDYMYYTLMCEARRRGFARFDFGRSKVDSGAYQYKVHWGISPQPLYQHYCLVRAGKLPDLSPNNPKYQGIIQLWQRLPLLVSQQLGPLLSRNLG